MLITLWSTPRTGGNWYGEKLKRDYQVFSNAYCLHELFNRNLYGCHYKNENGKVYILRDYSEGCYYLEYALDGTGVITETKVFAKQERNLEKEEQHRISLIRNANKVDFTLILSNHVSPMSTDIYAELCSISDRNIYLKRDNLKDQIASYCVTVTTKQYISFTEDPPIPASSIHVNLDILEMLTFRILEWHLLEKTGSEIVSFEAVDFNQYVDEDMPNPQDKENAFEALDDSTKEHVLKLEKYINEKITHYEKDALGVVPFEEKFEGKRILDLVLEENREVLQKYNEMFITTAPETSTHYHTAYKGDKSSHGQLVQLIYPSTIIEEKYIGTYIEEVVLRVKKVIEDEGLYLGRVRIIRVPVKLCYRYHRDPDKYRFHIPLHAKKGNFFIVSDKLYALTEVGRLYRIKTSELHTALNASNEDRYHMVFDTYF